MIRIDWVCRGGSSALLLVALVGCDSNATSQPVPAKATAKASTTAAATTSATATASSAPTGSTTAEAKVDSCKEHDLPLGGAGTRADPCKYDGDVLTASYADRIDDEGAVFRITNPWSEQITWLSAAVFYYDKAGKQLTVEVDGKPHRAARLDGIDVKIPGSKATEIALGFPKKDLPSEAKTIELQILGFGWKEEGQEAAFKSTTPFSRFRGIHGGTGPTGIDVCDSYRAKLETCPKQFPDALAAMRKSLRQYNNTSPETQKKLQDGLKSRCDKAMGTIAERCKPE